MSSFLTQRKWVDVCHFDFNGINHLYKKAFLIVPFISLFLFDVFKTYPVAIVSHIWVIEIERE